MFPAKRADHRVLILYLTLVLTALMLSSCSSFSFFNTQPEDREIEKAANEDSKEMQINHLEEKIVLLENKVTTLESQVAGQKKVVYTIEYSDPAKLYQKARNLLLENEFDDAADLFSTFAKEHPEHGLADNALYWLGECHYTKARYKEAVLVFKDLVNTYPKAAKVPDALLKTGYAYLSLDDINRASHFLKLVIKKHPFSQAAEKAQVKLKDFQ